MGEVIGAGAIGTTIGAGAARHRERCSGQGRGAGVLAIAAAERVFRETTPARLIVPEVLHAVRRTLRVMEVPRVLPSHVPIAVPGP